MDYRERFSDHQESIQTALDGRQVQIWTCMPGIVTAVDMPAMTVEVQPALLGVNVDYITGVASYAKLPVIPDVPIVFPSGGGYTITFPIAVGDECVLQFHSRCLDAWWQHGGVQPLLDSRLHDITDATAHFGPKSQPNVISNISMVSTQLRSDDGTISLDVNSTTGTMTVVAPTSVVMNTPVLMVTGDIVAGYGNENVSSLKHTHNQPPDSHGDAEEPTDSPNPGT